MADLLQKASDWLEEMRTRFMVRPVNYSRDTSAVDLVATVGKTLFRIDKGYGLTERSESRDYLILASDLVLDGSPVLPEAGDQIREVQANTVFVYEVMAPGNEPHYRFSDAYRKTLRVHTKLVATENTP